MSLKGLQIFTNFRLQETWVAGSDSRAVLALAARGLKSWDQISDLKGSSRLRNSLNCGKHALSPSSQGSPFLELIQVFPAVLGVLVPGEDRKITCQRAAFPGETWGQESWRRSFGGKERERSQSKAANVGSRTEGLSLCNSRRHRLELCLAFVERLLCARCSTCYL